MECFLCKDSLTNRTCPTPRKAELLTKQQCTQTLIRLFSFFHHYYYGNQQSASAQTQRTDIGNGRHLEALALQTQLHDVSYCRKCSMIVGQVDQKFKLYDSMGKKLEVCKDDIIIQMTRYHEEDTTCIKGIHVADGFRNEAVDMDVEDTQERRRIAPVQVKIHEANSNPATYPVVRIRKLEQNPSLSRSCIESEPSDLVANEIIIKQEPLGMDLDRVESIASYLDDLNQNFDAESITLDHQSESDSEYEPAEVASSKTSKMSKSRSQSRRNKLGKKTKLKTRAIARQKQVQAEAVSNMETMNRGSKLKRHICDFEGCSIVFETTSSLNQHITTDHVGFEPGWPCVSPNCTSRFFQKSNLTQHIHYVHSTQFNYPCPRCLQGFDEYDVYRSHQMKEHHVAIGVTGKLLTRKPVVVYEKCKRRILKPWFPCEFDGCDFRGRTEWKTQEHFQSSHLGVPRPYTCQSCGAQFMVEERLTRHNHWIHSNAKYPCQECDYVCDKLRPMARHLIEVHGKGENCPHENCDHISISTLALRRHLDSVHDGKRPHMCEHCGETFPIAQRLKYHMGRHHPELLSDPAEFNRYKCDQCGKILASPINLRLHMKSQHLKEHCCYCDVCGKGFIHQTSLRHHLKTHQASEEHPFECEVCQAKFRRKGALTIHMRRHTGEFKHVCRHCGKKFIDSSGLKRHERIHAGVLDHICPHCNKGFPMLGYLKTHLKSHATKEEKEELKKRQQQKSVGLPPLSRMYNELRRKRSNVASVAIAADSQGEVPVPEYPMYYDYRRERRNISRILPPPAPSSIKNEDQEKQNLS